MPGLYPKVSATSTQSNTNSIGRQPQRNNQSASKKAAPVSTSPKKQQPIDEDDEFNQAPKAVAATRKNKSNNEDGPEPLTNKRKCHDIPFLLLFIAFWGGMGYITYLAATTGNLNR